MKPLFSKEALEAAKFIDNSLRYDRPYSQRLAKLVLEGEVTEGRNGYTLSLFDNRIGVVVANAPALLVSKFTSYKIAKAEMDWMLDGVQNVKDLQDQNIHIWDKWVLADGTIGKAYGYQWRNFNSQGVDQWATLKHQIASLDKDAKRRLIMTAWNPAQLSEMALPPCHMMFQARYRYEASLDIYIVDGIMTQRSADWFLGVPYNVLGYSYLLHRLAKECTALSAELGTGARFMPGKLAINFGDYHIYGLEHGAAGSHLDAVETYLKHVVSSEEWARPDFSTAIRLDENLDLVKLDGFYAGPKIQAEVSA